MLVIAQFLFIAIVILQLVYGGGGSKEWAFICCKSFDLKLGRLLWSTTYTRWNIPRTLLSQFPGCDSTLLI